MQPEPFLLLSITWLSLQEVGGLKQQDFPSILPGPPAALHTAVLSDGLSPRGDAMLPASRVQLHGTWPRIPEEGTFSHS